KKLTFSETRTAWATRTSIMPAKNSAAVDAPLNRFSCVDSQFVRPPTEIRSWRGRAPRARLSQACSSACPASLNINVNKRFGMKRPARPADISHGETERLFSTRANRPPALTIPLGGPDDQRGIAALNFVRNGRFKTTTDARTTTEQRRHPCIKRRS